jgi:hypothetical protein
MKSLFSLDINFLALLFQVKLPCFSQSVRLLVSTQLIIHLFWSVVVIDLGNGVKTDDQLTFPAVGKGPFSGVLLIHGSGALDKNETTGLDVHNDGPKLSSTKF